MKSAVFLGSFLLGSLVAAAPLNKRAYFYETVTEEVVETVVVTSTVWVDAGSPAPATTSSAPGAFFEQTHTSKAPVSTKTPTPAYTPSSTPTPSSSLVPVYTPPPSSSSSSSSSTPAYTPPPAPSTSATPTSVYTPPVSTPSPVVSSAAPATSSATSASSGGEASAYGLQSEYSDGDLTWYDTGLGSCGITSGSSDPIVALSHIIMTPLNGANPNNNPLCGKKISINYGGETHTATIVDTCQGCAMSDLDMSEGFFNLVTNYGDGRVHGASWSLI